MSSGDIKPVSDEADQPSSSAAPLTWITRGPDNSIGLATQNGKVIRWEEGQGNLWEVSLSKQVSALSGLDLDTAEGESGDSQTHQTQTRFVTASGDGMAHLFDADGTAVRFELGEEICAFTCGMVTVAAKTLTPSMVFVTFRREMVIVHGVEDRGSLVPIESKAKQLIGTTSQGLELQSTIAKLLYEP